MLHIGSAALCYSGSAHLNSPAGGQGMNAGIQECGTTVAWKLALIEAAPTRAAPESYEEERYDAITHNVDVRPTAMNQSRNLGPF